MTLPWKLIPIPSILDKKEIGESLRGASRVEKLYLDIGLRREPSTSRPSRCPDRPRPSGGGGGGRGKGWWGLWCSWWKWLWRPGMDVVVEVMAVRRRDVLLVLSVCRLSEEWGEKELGDGGECWWEKLVLLLLLLLFMVVMSGGLIDVLVMSGLLWCYYGVIYFALVVMDVPLLLLLMMIMLTRDWCRNCRWWIVLSQL